MSFLYFLPEQRRRVNLDTLRNAGLGFVFDGDDWLQREVASGPNGQPGLILARHGLAASTLESTLGYFADRQEWRQGHDNAAFWLGCDPTALPHPDDLVRVGNCIDGHWLKFDDNRWLAPVARRWAPDAGGWVCNLPKRLGWSDDEERFLPVGVHRKHAALWRLAGRYHEAAMAALAEADPDIESTGVSFEFPDGDKLAVMAMQTNYRVGSTECDALGFWAEDTRAQILDALMDGPSWQTWVKKKLESESRLAGKGG